jgi:hypothetical protein
VAAQVDADALREADLVLAMDRSNLAALERLALLADVTTPIRLFREFDPDADGQLEVPDPYYGGAEGFAEVVRIARRAAREVVAHLAGGARPQDDGTEARRDRVDHAAAPAGSAPGRVGDPLTGGDLATVWNVELADTVGWW